MNKRDFDKLRESAAQGVQILRGERRPSRRFTRTDSGHSPVPVAGVWAVCVDAEDEPHLTTRRLYQVLAGDEQPVTNAGYIRILNDRGKVFRYPAEMFLLISLPVDVNRTLRKIA